MLDLESTHMNMFNPNCAICSQNQASGYRVQTQSNLYSNYKYEVDCSVIANYNKINNADDLVYNGAEVNIC